MLHHVVNFFLRYVVDTLKSRIADDAQRRRVANVTFPVDGEGRRRSSDYVQQMYADVPAAHVRALLQLYAVDYALFGFERPNVTGLIRPAHDRSA